MGAGDRKLIPIGKVGRPHGFRGAFVAHTDSGLESSLGSLTRLYVGATPETAVAYEITEAAWMPRGWKIALAGVATEEAAVALGGRILFAEREALPEIADGEFYLGDLVGAAVVDAETGETVGRFVELEPRDAGPGPALAHDRWWIEVAGKRVAVPATRRYIESVDVAGRTIRVRRLGECS